jgi:uncharacterized protein involved in outer membrane biogenesis
VQNTLLGLAIALIVALTTALAGPFFIDWSAYRAEFEASARRLTGLDLHITGAIDARLLPTPTLVMQDIEIARADAGGKVRAQALRIEFSVGALVRGEWRITDARLEGPELAAGIDAAGHLDWSAPRVSFNPEDISIERLEIERGRAVLTHAASGARAVVEKLEFRGELRSLSGPLKGEGSFVVAGQHFPYRLSTTRFEADSGVKVRVAVDPVDRPLAAQADFSISLERGAPHFEGNVQLARLVERAPAGSQSPIVEPWRITTHVKGDSTAAVLDQLELQYGPDEHATKLRGSADLTFGRRALLRAELSSPQIDLDRIVALPERERGRPLVAAQALVEALHGSLRIPVAASLGIRVESVGLAGATLQRLSAELESDGERLGIKSLEFRAPGVTQISFQQKPELMADGVLLGVATRIEANDSHALMAWLTGHSDEPAASPGSMRLVGDFTLSDTALGVERLSLDLERMSISGRLVYAWGGKGHNTRLDAELSAPEIDLDRAHALVRTMLGDTALDWPREGSLSLKIGHASLLGIRAERTDVNVRINGNGLEIDPITIADFGGATLAIRGRIDTRAQAPRGAVTLDLDARALDGILAVVEKVAPDAANELRRSAARVLPILLRASLTIDPGVANSLASAKLKADGRAGALRLAVLGDAVSASDAFKADQLAALAAAKINLMLRVASDEGAALVELGNLARFISVDRGPGTFTIAARGHLNGELDVESRLDASSLTASINGKVRAFARQIPRADLNLILNNAQVRSPRPVTGGRSAELVPLSLSTRLTAAGDTIGLTDLKGTVGGAAVSGRLAIGLGKPVTIEGEVDLDTVDLPGTIATGIGAPVAARGDSGTLWPGEPFEQMLGPLRGLVAVRSARVTLTPKLALHDFKSMVRFGDSRIALQSAEGSLAGGRLTGELIFLRDRQGLIARTQLALAGASASELLPGNGAISGRLRLSLSAEGSGMSAVAVIGSLEGAGTFTLEEGRLARLDPKSFVAVMGAVDRGLPPDANRLRDRVDAALASGFLAIPRAEGAITIAAGQAHLSNSMAGDGGSELSLNGRVNLLDSELDARLVLSGPSAAGVVAHAAPEIAVVLKGPVSAPKRSIDVANFASWLALRAVDQQSRKIDVLEGRAASPPAATDPPPQQPTMQRAHGDNPVPAAATSPQPSPPAPTARSVQKPRPPRARVQPAPTFDWRPLFFGAQ